MLFSLFLILTFTMRFFIEFIKNPQVDFEKSMSLDMGQWLSIPFVAIGIGILFYIYRNPKPVANTTSAPKKS
jgi:prolipoprotein diacylglyceryltransferase